MADDCLPHDRHATLRVVPMPADTNSVGDIFGGWIMSHVDVAGAIAAARRACGRVVTVAIHGLTFKKPVLVGDVVSFYAEVVRVGRTSITTKVDVYAERRLEARECVKVTEAELTYVAIDEQRHPRVVPNRITSYNVCYTKLLRAVTRQIELSPAQIQWIARRRFGVGCDQVLVLQAAERSGVDFSFRVITSYSIHYTKLYETRQREFFLREQLKAIQKELGIAKDDRTAELERFDARRKDMVLPEEASKRIDEEVQKLSVLELGSPEYAVTRNYLDWLTLLPWGKYSKDNLDLEHARAVRNNFV